MLGKSKNKLNLSSEVKSFIKTISIVAGSFGLFCLLILLLGKIGMFDKTYERPEVKAEEFSYNTALIGTVFNRPEDEYYVAFDEEDGSVLFSTLMAKYSGSVQIYKVNMSLGINSQYAGVKGNSGAKSSSELSIVCPTLIKIRNGKIIGYFEDMNLIQKELAG